MESVDRIIISVPPGKTKKVMTAGNFVRFSDYSVSNSKIRIKPDNRRFIDLMRGEKIEYETQFNSFEIVNNSILPMFNLVLVVGFGELHENNFIVDNYGRNSTQTIAHSGIHANWYSSEWAYINKELIKPADNRSGYMINSVTLLNGVATISRLMADKSVPLDHKVPEAYTVLYNHNQDAHIPDKTVILDRPVFLPIGEGLYFVSAPSRDGDTARRYVEAHVSFRKLVVHKDYYE